MVACYFAVCFSANATLLTLSIAPSVICVAVTYQLCHGVAQFIENALVDRVGFGRMLG
jgi:hypothetical protein